jgi:outer membrane protein
MTTPLLRSILLASTVALTATSLAAPATAKAGDWLIRARAIGILPTDGGNNGGVLPTFPTASIDVGNAYVPEVDFTYMATDNIGLELILATAKHSAKATGALAGLGKVASTYVLPPTLTLQWHFAPEAKIRPYAGVGVNYTIFYSEDAKDSLETAIGATSVSMKSSVGYALQAGVDFDLTDKVFINFDVKYIDLNTRAKLTTGALVNTIKVDLDPIVAGIGFGMRF